MTYTWNDSDQRYLRVDNGDGTIITVPANSDSEVWKEYVESGVQAGDYVEPAAPTAAQKLARSGLTVEELKTLLEIE